MCNPGTGIELIMQIRRDGSVKCLLPGRRGQERKNVISLLYHVLVTQNYLQTRGVWEYIMK